MDRTPSYIAIISADVRYDSSLTPNAKLLYGEITALSNVKGYCFATNKYFASLYNVSERTITEWVSKLEEKGYISVKVDTIRYEDGTVKKERRISINHIELLKQNHVEVLRENHVEENFSYNNINYFNNNMVISKEIKKNELENLFEEFWKLYPKKIKKKDSKRIFLKVCKNIETYELIIKGLNEHLNSDSWNKDNGKYIPYPSTWLNGERWNDEVISKQQKKEVIDYYEYL